MERPRLCNRILTGLVGILAHLKLNRVCRGTAARTPLTAVLNSLRMSVRASSREEADTSTVPSVGLEWRTSQVPSCILLRVQAAFMIGALFF